MSRQATVPETLRFAPFRGSAAVARGLITRGQLAGPAWRRLFHDVYINAGVAMDPYRWCQAAALVLPTGGALSHHWAAFLHGADLLSRTPGRVAVTVPVRARPRTPGGLLVHRATLSPADVVRRGGLPVTSRRRTAFDLGRALPCGDAVVALDALLHQRVIRAADLATIAADRRGWPGITRFRAAAALARAGAASPMETRLRLTLRGGGLPEPSVQYEVFDARGFLVGRLDLAYEECKVGLEYDGDHHRERAVFQRDAVRLNRLRLCGWTVLRFTADDVLRHPERVLAQVRAALKLPPQP